VKGILLKNAGILKSGGVIIDELCREIKKIISAERIDARLAIKKALIKRFRVFKVIIKSLDKRRLSSMGKKLFLKAETSKDFVFKAENNKENL